MTKTATITLGGVDYVLRPFNIGELEDVQELMEGPRHKVMSGLLRIATRRAEPAIADIAAVETTLVEMSAALDVITNLAGLTLPNIPGRPPGGGTVAIEPVPTPAAPPETAQDQPGS